MFIPFLGKNYLWKGGCRTASWKWELPKPRYRLCCCTSFFRRFRVPYNRWCRRRFRLLHRFRERIRDHRFWWSFPRFRTPPWEGGYFMVWYHDGWFFFRACNWVLKLYHLRYFYIIKMEKPDFPFGFERMPDFQRCSTPWPWKSIHHLPRSMCTFKCADELDYVAVLQTFKEQDLLLEVSAKNGFFQKVFFVRAFDWK